MKIIIQYFTAIVCFTLLFSCKENKLIIHGEQEYISLQLLDSSSYKYLYYALTRDTFIYEYNTGRYTLENKHYKLIPDSFNNESYRIECRQSYNSLIKGSLKIHVTTDIDDQENFFLYKIELLNNNRKIADFKNVFVDTLIDFQNFDSIKVKIYLPSKYGVSVNPIPTYASISTQRILLNKQTNQLYIHVPISFSTFFYKYESEIHLDDVGLFWKIRGNTVRMRNVKF